MNRGLNYRVVGFDYRDGGEASAIAECLREAFFVKLVLVCVFAGSGRFSFLRIWANDNMDFIQIICTGISLTCNSSSCPNSSTTTYTPPLLQLT
jgi:hypothetical protein